MLDISQAFCRDWTVFCHHIQMCCRCRPTPPQGSVHGCTHPTQDECCAQERGHSTAGCHTNKMHQPWESRLIASRGVWIARGAVAVRGKGRAPSCNSTSVFTLPISAVEAAVTSLVFRRSAALPSPFLWQEQPISGPLSSGWQCSLPPALLKSLLLALPWILNSRGLHLKLGTHSSPWS